MIWWESFVIEALGSANGLAAASAHAVRLYLELSPIPTPTISPSGDPSQSGDDGFSSTWVVPTVVTVIGTVVSAAVLGIIALIFQKTRKFGRKILGFLGWLFTFPIHLRLTTDRKVKAQLAAEYARGQSEKQAEVDNQRARILPPSWGIKRDARNPDLWVVRNWGPGVQNVRIAAPHDIFVFDSPPHFDEVGGTSAGTSVGKTFDGTIGPRGNTGGLVFDVSWDDQNGDRHSEKVAVATLVGETNDQAYQRGVDDRQRELDEERAVPEISPVWLIGPLGDASRGADWGIANVARGSIATSVSLTATPSYFQMLEAGVWVSINGDERYSFKGGMRENGRMLGVDFYIEWRDSHGDPQSTTYSVQAPGL